MDERLKSKAAKVLVIESSASARTQLTDVLKSLGFNGATGAPNIKVALGVLEAEPIDWVITPLFADQAENALHLLEIITKAPELKSMRISLMLEENETFVLPLAFTCGVFSWHKKVYAKENLSEEFRKLLELCEAENYESAFVAGHFLRTYLLAKEQFDDLLAFEKSLIKVFPSKSNLLFNLVEPYARLGKKDEARAILKQIKLLDPEQEEKVKKYASRLLDPGALDSKGDEASDTNLFGLENVIVVDSDEAMQKNITEIFGSVGVKGVQCFENGEEALKHIKENPNPQLIIHEWRIPKVTGPLFLQRARKTGAESTAFVVLSSLIKKEDVPLLKEMGVAEVISKPCERYKLLQKLVWVVQQDRMPTDKESMERKIRNLLRSKKISEAAEIINNYLANESIPQGDRDLVAAELSYAEGNYESAKNQALHALKRSGDSIQILNLLGKTMLRLRDLETALKCFERAQNMSPSNIERLCVIAEVKSELGDQEGAEAALDQAKDLDVGHEGVKETDAKLAVNAGDLERARKIMGELDALDNVVAYMNNQAVIFAKSEQFDKGVDYYRKAIETIPDEKGAIKAIVIYNLALAYARNDKLDEAKAELERCVEIKQSKVLSKAKSLMKRINTAIDTSEPLTLKLEAAIVKGPEPEKTEARNEAEAEEDVNQTVRAALMAKQGDMGCFLIYNPSAVDEKAKDMLKNPPRFKFRAAIERAETGGADRTLKTS